MAAHMRLLQEMNLFSVGRFIRLSFGSYRPITPGSIYTKGRTIDRHVPFASISTSSVDLSRTPSSGKRNFIGDFIENIKSEMNKNKEMKESLKKFREEAEKLEQSESLQKARRKYQAMESETLKGSDSIKKSFEAIQGKLKETMDDVEKSEYAKKGKEWVEEVGKTMGKTAESVSKQGEQITRTQIYRSVSQCKTMGKTAESVSKQGEQIIRTQIYRSVSQGVKAVKEEMDESGSGRGRLYRPPAVLRKREEAFMQFNDDKPIEPNTDASGMVLHRDSQWYQSWQSFKDNNQVINKLFDMKTKFDESDNLLIRATRTVTDKFTELFGGVFSRTEMSEVLTEIVRMDPTFDREQFIKQCQFDMIPNILEAMVRGDLEILEDWCYEAAFNVIATPIRHAKELNYKLDSRVLDVNHIDLVAGKMMEQGPVLVLSFNAQQIMVVRDSSGKVVEGDAEKIMRVYHVWAFCRDQSILNPKAAWRLIDLSSSPVEQWL